MNIVDALVVTLGLDSSGFKKGQQDIASGIQKISNDAKKSQENIQQMGSSLVESGKAMQASMQALPRVLYEVYAAITRLTEQVTGVKQLSLGLDEFLGIADEAAKKAREAADAVNGVGNSGNSIDNVSEKTRRLGEAGSKLGKEFGRSGDQMARSLRGVANELISVFALSKGGSFLGGQVVDSIKSQADTARKAANMGLSANELKTQEWLIQRQGGTSEDARQSFGNFYSSLLAAENSPDIPDWLQFLRSSGVQLVDEKGDLAKPDHLLSDIADAFDREGLDQKTRNWFMQQMGFSEPYGTLVNKGGAYIRQQTKEIESQTGLTPEGLKNAQEFQRQSIESLQSLEGAWNKFIGENAPALTEALQGLTSEVLRFGSDIKRNVDEYSHHSDDHYAGLEGWDKGVAYVADVITGTVSGGDAEKGYQINKSITEFINPGKKQSSDGILYDPSALEGGPDDSRYKGLHFWQKRNLESKIQARDAGNIPSVWKDDPKLREYDEAIWAEHQKRLDWEKKQTELIEKNGYKAIYPSLPEGGQIKTGGLSSHAPIGSLSTQRASETPENPNLLKDMEPVRYEGAQSVDDVAQRILFKESRGRRYDQNGNIKVNKKSGATGEYQILPSTAHDPTLWKRYRVKPARDDSPDEYARVARDLIAAYHRKYNGDSQKIMSAYNAGDGATDSAIAKWGAEWRKHMPGETRGYMDFDPSQKNFGGYPAERLAKQPSREEQRAVAGMQKLMQGINQVQSMRSGNQQQPFLDVPPQIRAQTSPAMSPGVQQAMSSDNRTITSTTATHIDNVNVHVPGGNSKEIAGGIGSALQRHPLINGADYA